MAEENHAYTNTTSGRHSQEQLFEINLSRSRNLKSKINFYGAKETFQRIDSANQRLDTWESSSEITANQKTQKMKRFLLRQMSLFNFL